MAQPVTDVMTAQVVTLRPEQTIEEAVTILGEHGISGAPVVDQDGRLVGLLDDTDLILSEARVHAPTTIEILGAYFPLPGERHRFEEELRAALGQTVADVMESDPATVPVDASVEDVATIIVDRDVSRVPVLDADRRVAGIVTRGDLVKGMYRALG
jgi:CBS domain-containing protein